MTGEVRLENVTKRYGTFAAVDNVTLSIEGGEFLSLLGPSGAGKSTVLRIIGGFARPDNGRIYLNQTDVTQLPPHRRAVNTVFQHYALFPHMTVAENVAYGLRQDGVPRDERRTRVQEALEMVSMLPFAHRKPNELSGGQQQRVALARALVKRPTVLLLDEPLGALDRKLRQQMQIELKLLQREVGITFVYVTHDQEEALAMSDRIAVMKDGRIEQIGTASELYDTPRTAFVADFIGLQNFLRGRTDDRGKILVTDDQVIVEAGRVADGVAHGRYGLAAIRPEDIDISSVEPDGPANKARGTIAEIVHLGDVLEFVVILPSGLEVLSRLPRKAARDLKKGQEVWIGWSRGAVTIYAAESDESFLARRWRRGLSSSARTPVQ